jgi:hypothetical protein
MPRAAFQSSACRQAGFRWRSIVVPPTANASIPYRTPADASADMAPSHAVVDPRLCVHAVRLLMKRRDRHGLHSRCET